MNKIKKEFVGVLNDLSKFIEYIIENNEIEKKVNDLKFSEMLKNISYYKIDEIIDYLETLIKMEGNYYE